MNQKNELAKVIETSGLDATKGQVLLEKFTDYFNIAADWERKAKALVITDVSQTTEMKMAREARLFLSKKRIDVEKTRKALKEDSLREGQTIDAIAKVLKNLIEPIEKDLEQKERFAEIKEAERKMALLAERTVKMQPYVADTAIYPLADMAQEAFDELLAGTINAHNARIEAERKAEEARIAKEKAEAEERERIRIENERLKAEAIAKEKQMAAERAKAEAERKAFEEKVQKEKAEAEARLKAEKAANDKLQAEIKAKAEAEAKAKHEAEAKAADELKAKKAAEQKAMAAPDKVKLLGFAKTIDELMLPELKSKEAEKILADTKILIAKVSEFIRKQSDNL